MAYDSKYEHIVYGDGNCLFYAVQAGILYNTGTPREEIDKFPDGWEELKEKMHDNIDSEAERLGMQSYDYLKLNNHCIIKNIYEKQTLNEQEASTAKTILSDQFLEEERVVYAHFRRFLAGDISLLDLFKAKLQHHLNPGAYGDYFIIDSLAHVLDIPIRIYQSQTQPHTVNESSTGQLVCIVFKKKEIDLLDHFDAYLPDVIDLTETPAHELLLCMWEYVPRPLPRV